MEILEYNSKILYIVLHKFGQSSLISSINKTDRHNVNITEILLKVALNTINHKPFKKYFIIHLK